MIPSLTDREENVIVTGLPSDCSGPYKHVTIKYSSAGVAQRTNRFAAASGRYTACIAVEAAGSAPLSYHWCKDGTNLVNGGKLSGVTTTNLVIALCNSPMRATTPWW